MNDDRLLNQSEAARLLGLSTRTLEAWRRHEGRGPKFVRLGACVRYRQSDLEAFVEAGCRTSTAGGRR